MLFDDYLDDNVFSFDIHSLDPCEGFGTAAPAFDLTQNPFCFDWILQQSHQPYGYAHAPPSTATTATTGASDDFCVDPSTAASIPSSFTTLASLPSLSPQSQPSALPLEMGMEMEAKMELAESSSFDLSAPLPRDRLGSSAGSTSSSSSSDESHSGPMRKYKCSLCPRAFARQFNLKQHIQTHNPDRVKPHECTYEGCGRRFSRKHDLVRHAQSIHGVAGPPTKASRKQSPQAIAEMIARRQKARNKTISNLTDTVMAQPINANATPERNL
ncbi:DNA-binding protein scr1 [Wallemia ichthyophaga EXF-994]|uniref:DNA-binding protein scr1 n=1 Tax=Wallemia ichthyophaga (strain EXF-994 / CBS 113033) TaxID=1299270 RepID=R9AIT0_WALI9|nr:DNA-binding protein scr1 [Wallemia ichthyophaga EXF-994]EOR02020.1 DNA-binding protein scr1 [Wallemia ichthyophaga EXF-994]